MTYCFFEQAQRFQRSIYRSVQIEFTKLVDTCITIRNTFRCVIRNSRRAEPVLRFTIVRVILRFAFSLRTNATFNE